MRSSIWPGASHGRVVLPGVGVDTEIDIGAADATDRQSERQSPMAGCGWASLCCHESARTWRLTLPLPTPDSVTVTLKAPSMSAQAKTEKGAYVPVGSRAAAKLEDGSPAVVINTLGKGEVVWLPHRLKIEGTAAPIPTTIAPPAASR